MVTFDNISVDEKVSIVELEDIIDVACSIFHLQVLVRGGIGTASIDNKLELLSYFYVDADFIDLTMVLSTLLRG